LFFGHLIAHASRVWFLGPLGQFGESIVQITTVFDLFVISDYMLGALLF
jgi:hypothetical protein